MDNIKIGFALICLLWVGTLIGCGTSQYSRAPDIVFYDANSVPRYKEKKLVQNWLQSKKWVKAPVGNLRYSITFDRKGTEPIFEGVYNGIRFEAVYRRERNNPNIYVLESLIVHTQRHDKDKIAKEILELHSVKRSEDF